VPSTSRERKRLLDAQDAARAQGHADMPKWSTAAAKEAAKHLAADSRTPDDVSRDLGTEMMAARLAKTVSGRPRPRTSC
jgi:hypothetical protein